MKHGTKIEWTHIPGYKGETWNPVTGCTKVSEGCKFCYAERDWPRLKGNPKTVQYGREFTDVATHDERLIKPFGMTKPRAFFVNSMSDFFHESLSFQFLDKVLETIAQCPQHIFIILTKRPEIAYRYFQHVQARGIPSQITKKQIIKPNKTFMGQPWPLPNLWLGVSIENQKTAIERIQWLLKCPASLRIISYEPALGPVDLSGSLSVRIGDGEGWPTPFKSGGIDWVIAGGESGPSARPSNPEWFQNALRQCVAANVPYFFKQWGEFGPECYCGHGKNHKRIDRPMPGKAGFMYRCGRKATGHLLDGREWQQFPDPSKYIPMGGGGGC